MQLLAELNAIDERNVLTPIGGELARLRWIPCGPNDAGRARTELPAEMLVIAAALSCRIRANARWRRRRRPTRRIALRRRTQRLSCTGEALGIRAERIGHKKSNRKLTEELRSQFLSPRRVREWIDVHGQLAALAGEQGWRPNATPASFEQVHLALLAGLLGNIGCRVLDAERGSRRLPVRAASSSSLARVGAGEEGGRWIMAAELVETSRLFARTVATIEQSWLEQIGAHLLKKSHGNRTGRSGRRR